jgi:short subunit dehydrogenase-like uncharacterized protein
LAERDLDVVVFGATGVTGRRVAAYLSERAAEDGVRWAAAARDSGKLQRVLAEAGVTAPEAIAADIGDPASLSAMAARTSVVLDLVGPYTLYGRPVVQACVAEGSHYADLTGEMPFVRATIDEFDGAARAAGVKVAQVCGFEALPPDLAVVLAARAAGERHGEPLADVEMEASVTPPPGLPRPSDGISGGTLQSLLAALAGGEAKLIEDPAVLVDDPDRAAEVRRISPIGLAPHRGLEGGVIAPLAPAPFINPAVIHRTAALSDGGGGAPAPPFRYREGMVIPGPSVARPMLWGVAGAITATQMGLRGVTRSSPNVRRRIVGALERVTPKSGFGPAADRLENWGWQMAVRARTPAGHELRVTVDADGHPGYLATARMLGELGILLAREGATPARSGCMTPGLALGAESAERFARAGVRFSLEG